MNSWVLFALATIFLWGVWGLALKIASEALQHWPSTYVLSYLASLTLAIGIIVFLRPQIQLGTPAIVAVIGAYLER
jgi:hypothetical protein